MNERRKQINDYIQLKKEVVLNDLRALVPDVSEMTIRRDLEALEQEGYIIRVHGGAKSIKSISGLVEDVFSKRSAINIDKKQKIGELAAGLISAEQSIYLDSGSTTMALAEHIPNIRLLILTSGLNIALELLKLENSTINIIGGEVNKSSISLAGPQATAGIMNLNIDMAFIAATAFSKDGGFTCGNIHDSELKSHVLAKAKKRIILMDSSKIEKTMPYTFAWPSDIDILVTDDELSQEIREYLINRNVQILS